ncbi:aminotransferase class I/II-fold pyridoxal phosphate-dependent enzyme [Qipengyuania sp. 6B39]|uniref:pyridoxal phosphate-dependent aminotransferase n=1 Tax=Qipengyuania proteolytica TaxID=2867239 RepID=UPI001C88EE4C|nr:histidinol-phosphate transaminase [Qipengyuania proteolytica]MBX7494935.1 aminotransferase class I/II-fold pyridoxal phosphate-dependent enzyme [Qipengyuania proteolytica]
MADKPILKPWIEAIHAYVPGKSKAADGRPLVKLSANENPLGCSPQVIEALSGGHQPNLYPDPDATQLREAIGALHGIDPARIVCGTGSGECLHGAVQAFAGPGDEVLFSRYSFSLYPLLAYKVGAEVVQAEDNDYAPDVDKLLAAVTERTRVVLLDNPNNPIGTFLPRAEVERLHAGLPKDVLLVVDQAYAEFLPHGVDDGGMDLAAQHDNVLVTRTFAKAYGIAGERVGWATGAPHLVDALNRLRGAFNVTASGQRAALAALADQDFVAKSRDANAAARARFVEQVEALGNHGLRALPSEANFVLVVFEGDLAATTALDAIAGAGYAVRHLPGQGLPQALRITVGTNAQMDAIAAVLRELCEAPA